MASLNSVKTKSVFSLFAPAARSVALAGDFSEWDKSAVALKKQKGGLWKATVPLDPGPHEYRFLVDGQWSDDPECPTRVPNSLGGENCVRVVS